ncbi:hypothetical protein [Streptomyces sp. NBC_00490]|uniref:hypothetical protein n=1 Tax=Streptomyces sp. NBC_00490 TaxID=2903657 RepID=UPI002E19DE90
MGHPAPRPGRSAARPSPSAACVPCRRAIRWQEARSAEGDLAAARPAEVLVADLLLLLTEVPDLYAGYGIPDREAVLDLTPTEPPGCPTTRWVPRAETAARFVENTGGLAVIGALDAVYEIVHGRSGTLVRAELPVVRGA